jgi:hypothetical protein
MTNVHVFWLKYNTSIPLRLFPNVSPGSMEIHITLLLYRYLPLIQCV